MIATSPQLGRVYFILSPRMKAIKIGYTIGSIGSRLAELSTGNADYLIIVGWRQGTERDERETHKLFKAHHMRGEWFGLTEELRDYIADCECNAGGLLLCDKILSGEDVDLPFILSSRNISPKNEAFVKISGGIDDTLRKAIADSGISAKKIAAETGLLQTTISRFLRGHEMSSGKMAKIAAYLGLELK